MNTAIPSHLSDDELVAEVRLLVRRDRDTTAHLVAHLAELDARRLYLGAGFSSLYTSCREVLQLSESESYNRIEAARAARKFPIILDMLGDGSVNLTIVRLLARYLTDENHRELLTAASGRSKLEVEELVARQFPRPDVPSSIRKLPEKKSVAAVATPASSATSDSAPSIKEEGDAPVTLSAPLPSLTLPPATSHRPVVTPLASDRYEIRFTASGAICEKLRLAKDLLRHAVPTADTAEVFDRALTALLDDLAKKKLASTERPRPSRGTAPGSRHIPAKVKRAVWLRDGGRCAFTGNGGRRCTERGYLEFHHIEPYGVGGPPTEQNLQLACRTHNAYEAELFYGPHKVGTGVVRESTATYGVRSDAELALERVR